MERAVNTNQRETNGMKVGFLAYTAGTSQLGTQLMKGCNNLAESKEASVSVFIREFDKLVVQPQFPLYQCVHAWDYKGVLISTDFDTTMILKTTYAAKKKLHYVWNLDWLFNRKFMEEYRSVYCDDSIDLIARSQEHYDIIKGLWKEPTDIIEDFNYEDIIKTVKKYS
jgi:hypothetical protein